TSTDLNSAGDGQIVGVEAISAAGAASGVTITLTNQTEGFSITGSAFADTITGGAGNDTITGVGGSDVLARGSAAQPFELPSTAETVTGLVGDIAAGSLTGGLTVTTGDAVDNGISITAGSVATSITASGTSDVISVNATVLGDNVLLTLAGSAAETVTGLAGNIAAGSLTGALTVTTGNAGDDGISITTGSAATSITASGTGDTITVTANSLAQAS